MIFVAIFLVIMSIISGHAVYKASAGPKKERVALGVCTTVFNIILIISAFFLKSA